MRWLTLTCVLSEKRLKTNTLTLTVSEEFVGQRLDRYLASLNEVASRNYAQDLIDKGFVLVDRAIVKASHALKLNQQVEIFIPAVAETTKLVPYDFKLDIVFEDSDLLVVNKPSGLVVHPAVGHQQDTLVNALLHHTKDLSMKNEQRPGIVHRIDKETSGLLVVAKNDRTHEALAAQFKNKTTHRIYYALVDGGFPRVKGTIQSYLARHPLDRKRYASLKTANRVISTYEGELAMGKWAITHYERISQSSAMSYMKLQLETGRTHQIRVHLTEANHRIVGDVAYGYPSQKMKANNFNRFYLHAAELGFLHPVTKEELKFKVPWPADDVKRLNELGFKNEILAK